MLLNFWVSSPSSNWFPTTATLDLQNRKPWIGLRWVLVYWLA